MISFEEFLNLDMSIAWMFLENLSATDRESFAQISHRAYEIWQAYEEHNWAKFVAFFTNFGG